MTAHVEGSTVQPMFKLTYNIQIVPAFGGFVVYRSALVSSKHPVWKVCDSLEEAEAYRRQRQGF